MFSRWIGQMSVGFGVWGLGFGDRPPAGGLGFGVSFWGLGFHFGVWVLFWGLGFHFGVWGFI